MGAPTLCISAQGIGEPPHVGSGRELHMRSIAELRLQVA